MPFRPYMSTSAMCAAHVLSTLQETLMCIYFHPNSHLLSSGTSHVYEPVHLPRGCVRLPSLLLLHSASLVKQFLNVRYLQGCRKGKSVAKKTDEVMDTCNTSIAWTSPEKTNDTVVKSTGQVDLAVAVISLNKRTVVWMNGWNGGSWIYLTFYDLMARFDFAGVCACAQTQIMTLVMMSRSTGLCGKHHLTSQLFALFYWTTRFHFPASTFWYFHLFDPLSRIFLYNLASSPRSPFPSCCTSTSTA